MEEENRKRLTEKREIGRYIRIGLLLFLTAVIAAGVMWFTMRDIYSRDQALMRKYEKLLEVGELIESRYIGEVDMDAVLDGAVDGMLEGLGDRWSHYIPLDEMEEHEEHNDNAYEGIGISCTKEEGEAILIVEVAPGSGAAKAGLLPGDSITAVDGTDVRKMPFDDAKKLIKGQKGTKVTLSVLRADGTEEEIAVKRTSIKVDNIVLTMMEDVGYITIANFNDNAASDFRRAVKDAQSRGAKGLVFDVRFNGGGYLTELLDMLDFLLPDGRIFSYVDNEGNEEIKYSAPSCVELPMAVLINDNTYSSAEFFAEALHEFDWAVTVGTPTTGKGYSQATFTLCDGSALALSTKAYFTPNGESLADVGVTPDIAEDLSEEAYYKLYLGKLAPEDDSQLQLALQSVRERIS